MAQLYIGGKPYGPHPFVCQIRDMKTHEPLEGVHVGDIGPKFGYNTMDNGFLLFNRKSIDYYLTLLKILSHSSSNAKSWASFQTFEFHT
jgi:acyl-CoA oxidase